MIDFQYSILLFFLAWNKNIWLINHFDSFTYILIYFIAPAPRKKLRKRKGEDTDEDYEDDANFDLSNTFILSGPVGCGKTAAVS